MVYMLLGTGFEETEAIAPLDLLRRADIPVLTVGINGKTVYGSRKIGIEADITLEQMDLPPSALALPFRQICKSPMANLPPATPVVKKKWAAQKSYQTFPASGMATSLPVHPQAARFPSVWPSLRR